MKFCEKQSCNAQLFLLATGPPWDSMAWQEKVQKCFPCLWEPELHEPESNFSRPWAPKVCISLRLSGGTLSLWWNSLVCGWWAECRKWRVWEIFGKSMLHGLCKQQPCVLYLAFLEVPPIQEASITPHQSPLTGLRQRLRHYRLTITRLLSHRSSRFARLPPVSSNRIELAGKGDNSTAVTCSNQILLQQHLNS